MDNSSDTVLTKKSCCSSQNHLPFNLFRQPSFQYYIIKLLTSDAESCEEEDVGKQKFVGGMMAKLWPIFHLAVAKNTENQRFKLC